MIEIYINKEGVLADVARRAYTYGQVATDDERVRWLLQGVADRGKKEIINNAFADGIEMAVQAMNPYVDEVGEFADDEADTHYIKLVDIEKSLPNLAKRLKHHTERLLEHSCMSAWKQVMEHDAGVELAAMHNEAWQLKVIVNTRKGITKQKID